MFKNHLIYTLRSIKKQKTYTLINLLGLAIGMACCMLMILYVRDELSYDRFYKNADRIYRVTSRYSQASNYQLHFARCPEDWIRNMPQDYPEVLGMARFHNARSAVRYGDKKFYEERFYVTDPNVFDVFDYQFVSGSPAGALDEPYSLVMTEDAARRYFGETDPVGSMVSVINHFKLEKQTFTVTGVIKTIPRQSHFHFDMLASLGAGREPLVNEWNYIYILLPEGYDPGALEAKFPEFKRKYESEAAAARHFLHLQPLTGIHLRSHLDRELEPNGNILHVYVFSFTAFLTLLIACINFMNLSTARSIRRRRETGLRKVFGARRRQLFAYNMGEAILFSLAALLAAIVIVVCFLPVFSALTGKTLTPETMADPQVLMGFAGIALFTGIVSGAYQALYIASFDPSWLIRQSVSSAAFSRRGAAVFMRKALVVFQFSISIALIICAGVIYSQLRYVESKDIGLNTDGVLAISNVPFPVTRQYYAFKANLSGDSRIADVTACMQEPSKEILDAGYVFAEGVESTPESPVIVYANPAAENFIEFAGIELLAGTTLTNVTRSDSVYQYVLNESALNLLGWESPEYAVGKSFRWRQFGSGTVIGVVRDHHFSTLQKSIKPMVLFYRQRWFGCILIRIGEGDTAGALSFIKDRWNTMFPDYPFEYNFLDDLYGNLYDSEYKQGRMTGLFSLLATFIACLGLFGLAAFSSEQRTKEIGIRKALGASAAGIAALLSREFTRWVLITNVIAWPAAWYAMDIWLQNFAYRIALGWGIFVLAGVSALAVALLTVITQAVRAARVNPADSLRHE